MFLPRLLAVMSLFGMLSFVPAFAEEGTDLAPPAESLAALLQRTNQLQTFDLATLYEPPPDAEYGQWFRTLGHGQAVLNLVTNASAFAATENGLVVGLSDGGLQVFGPKACSRMDQNLPALVDIVAYGARSRYLAAVDAGHAAVAVYDLENCALAETRAMAEVVSVAVSSSGAWLAVARQDGVMLAGPPNGPLRELPLTLTRMLGVGFGPEQGVLYAMDRSGEVVLWNLVENVELGRFTVEDGPYQSLRFHDQYMVLDKGDGKQISIDLAQRKRVPYTRQLAQFFLQDNTLRYRTWNPLLRTGRTQAAPELTARHSPDRGMIWVTDLDGADRCYDTGTGQDRFCAPAPDWREVEIGPTGGFFLGETGYRLADLAFQVNHDALLCRWVSEGGWFLWWVKSERPRSYSPLPDHLPQRTSIRADKTVTWSPILSPPQFP
ncbi:MAG: hypothetical protein KKB70_10150 [Proteobacteria bacterium]|nr:hypothetical protein [Pseudomonadota bacterium]